MKKKSNLIIVDDNIEICETLKDIFDDIGYKVTIANNGYDVIELIRSDGYDFILMDIKMPGINGVETFKKIKEINPKLKVIMMTAYSLDDLINEAKKEGAYAIFNKPLDIKRIIRLIESC
ncbi:MAG: response regulator [Candidatus Helarchaeota archaeon]